MSADLDKRLNEILRRVIDPGFLSGTGIGKELAFYIFDYPAECELKVREHIAFLLEHIPAKKPGLRVQHVNLLDLVINYLKSRNLLDKAIQMQGKKGGDEAVTKALAGPLHPDRLAPIFKDVARPDQHDLMLVSGVGSVFPVLRTSAFLTKLHSVMGDTPLVLFYPGKYDQMTLRLFGKLRLSSRLEFADDRKHPEPYYRAIRLIP